jgi:hypothetical protein
MHLSDLEPGDKFIFSNCTENTVLYVRCMDDVFEALEMPDYPKAIRLSDGAPALWKVRDSLSGDPVVIRILK